MIKEILEFNEKFVQNKEYEPYITSKYPDKKLAILTCMDTRLTVLLPETPRSSRMPAGLSIILTAP